MAFHRRVAGIHVFLELHWAWAGSESLMRDFAIAGDAFLGGYCARQSDGCLAASRLGQLLFVAVHGARHAFSRWIWLLDLHRLVERGPLDWRELVRNARELRIRRPLYAGLAASRELFRTSVPKEVLASLAPGPLRRQLLHRSLAASHREAAHRRSGRVAKLLLGESWWDVARSAAWAAAPGPGWYAERGELAGMSQRVRHPVRVLRGEVTRSPRQSHAMEVSRVQTTEGSARPATAPGRTP